MLDILVIEIIVLATVFYSVLFCGLVYRFTKFFIRNKDKLLTDNRMVQLNDLEESSVDSEENSIYYTENNNVV